MLLTRLRRLGRGTSGPLVSAGAGGAALPLSVDPELGAAEAEVVEGPPRLRARPVGPPSASGFGAFLDGIQRAGILGFVGHVPIVYAHGAAVVRTRRGRRLETLRGPAGPFHLEREGAFLPTSLVEPAALAALGLGSGEMHDTGPPDAGPLPLFPPLLHARAFEAVNRWREGIERELAERWCRETRAARDESPAGTPPATGGRGHDEALRGGFLLVDGSLTVSAELAACRRAVGVVKGHRTRFFDGEDARTVLSLREGERSSVFRPGTRTFTPVYSWYLRLRKVEGRGPLWGLVRVEAPAEDATVERADALSRWLLAERAPLALPDARWDRLLYPIRDCEAFLRARAPAL